MRGPLALPGAARGGAAPAFAASVERWWIERIALASCRAVVDPFGDTTLTARVTCAGTATEISGFHDGGHSWKLRFMPEAVGTCRLRTRSNDTALDGASGAFTVAAAGSGNLGPVRRAKVHHFSHADGTPFFLLGTTSYNWRQPRRRVAGPDVARSDASLAQIEVPE